MSLEQEITRRIQAAQHHRIIRFAHSDESGTDLSGLVHFALRIIARGDGNPCRHATALCKFGYGIQRRTGGSKMIDEVAKGGGADILAANQAQPVQALLVGEIKSPARARIHPLLPILPSVPLIMRLILSLCR